MMKKKLSCAILLATFGQSAFSFDFFLHKTFDTKNHSHSALTFLFKTNLADIDNDGDIDILVGSNDLWLNNGQAHFVIDHTPDEEILGKNRVFLVDIDNDGDMGQLPRS